MPSAASFAADHWERKSARVQLGNAVCASSGDLRTLYRSGAPEHSCLVYSPCWQLTGSDVRLALLRSNIIQDRWLTYGGDIVDASDALTVELLHSNLPQCGIEDRQARQAPCVFIASSHAVRIACEAARTFNIE